MPGIGIITNPHSKENKRNPERAELMSYIVGTKGKLVITEDLSHLEQVARHFRDSNVEILAINGGDGTISRTITAFIRNYGDKPLPKIALLRGGTMNVLASNLGLRGRPERLLYKLVEGYSDLDTTAIKEIRTLKMDELYGFVYADGVAYRFLAEFYKSKKHWLAAIAFLAKIVLSTLVRGKLYKKIVHSDDSVVTINDKQSIPTKTTAVFVSTIEKLSFGARMFKELGFHPDRFESLFINSSPNRLLFNIPSILLRRFPGTKVKESICTNRIGIKRGPGFPYSLDGELHNSVNPKLEITLGPSIRFLSKF